MTVILFDFLASRCVECNSHTSVVNHFKLHVLVETHIESSQCYCEQGKRMNQFLNVASMSVKYKK